jgi:hypothetical protein
MRQERGGGRRISPFWVMPSRQQLDHCKQPASSRNRMERRQREEKALMRLAFKLHDTSPPFVELCLETWRQDVHGGAPIISPHLATADEIRRSCANFRAQIDRVEREAIAALLAKKKS